MHKQGAKDNETRKEKKVKGSGKTKNELITLKVLNVVREAQLAHGLRHNDYQLYRQYCTRRLRRIRKNVGLLQGDRKTFRKKKITVLKEERTLYVPLFSIERCWAYAMQLKEESVEDSRKKFSMRNKLRKGAKYVIEFENLVETSEMCDARTMLEVQGYSAWLQGTVLFEMAESTGEWQTPVNFFNKAQAIYSKLSKAVSDDEADAYKHKIQELEVKLRYCRHHLGDKAATDTLLAMHGNVDLGDKLDRLVTAAREHQASTLSEVTWKGRTLAVKHEKVRMFLLNERLIHNKLKDITSSEQRASMIDDLLMACKDAVQLVREDLKNDNTFKPRQQATEGPTTPLHFLHTYLIYLRLSLTNMRNWAMYHTYSNIISGKKELEQNKKAPKLQDIIRLCELSVQNLTEMSQLAGLESDLDLKRESDALTLFYKAFRDFYAAESYISLEKQQEAFAIYERCSKYIVSAQNVELPDALVQDLEELVALVESRKFAAHAQLFTNLVTSSEDTALAEELSKKLLIDRRDDFFEDQSLTTSPKVATVPPQMEAVPCKPLFFDLALNHIEFPYFEDEVTPDSPAKPQKPSGIRGLVGNLWGWGS